MFEKRKQIKEFKLMGKQLKELQYIGEKIRYQLYKENLKDPETDDFNKKLLIQSIAYLFGDDIKSNIQYSGFDEETKNKLFDSFDQMEQKAGEILEGDDTLHGFLVYRLGVIANINKQSNLDNNYYESEQYKTSVELFSRLGEKYSEDYSWDECYRLFHKLSKEHNFNPI
jgi:hypothetical protein